jgi:hypothetical protein
MAKQRQRRKRKEEMLSPASLIWIPGSRPPLSRSVTEHIITYQKFKKRNKVTDCQFRSTGRFHREFCSVIGLIMELDLQRVFGLL